MTSFTFGTRNSLSQKEFIALQENKFELNCLKMRLESLASEGRVFSGPGVIRQTSEGQMHFTLYAQETVPTFESLQELIQGMGIPSGSIIPKNKYYRLSAIDLQGRKWVCEQVFLDTNSSSEGTICTGRLDEIIYKSDERESTKDFLYLEIFDDVKFPYNVPMVINKTVAGKESSSSSLNALNFNACGFEFLLRKDETSLLLSTKSIETEFVEYIEIRIIEALQFAIARPLLWSIMIKGTGRNVITRIRETRSNNLSYKIQPPISPSLDNTEWFCKLFELYLKYILQCSEDKLHPVSAQMRSIYHASIGNIEAKSLIISVAVESILKYVHESKFSLSPEEEEWIKKAREHFGSWGGPENLCKRIIGLFSLLSKPSASMRLQELVEAGAITNEQRQAWNKLRNKLAHGGVLGSASLQEFLELSNTVLVLFYHLVFFAIGYEGKYTDYSTLDWPIKDYRVTPQSKDGAT